MLQEFEENSWKVNGLQQRIFRVERQRTPLELSCIIVKDICLYRKTCEWIVTKMFVYLTQHKQTECEGCRRPRLPRLSLSLTFAASGSTNVDKSILMVTPGMVTVLLERVIVLLDKVVALPDRVMVVTYNEIVLHDRVMVLSDMVMVLPERMMVLPHRVMV